MNIVGTAFMLTVKEGIKINTLTEKIKHELDGKSIAILGFGREGKATYEFIKKYVNYTDLAIADKSHIEVAEKVYLGNNYCDELNKYDIIIKSPGIAFKDIKDKVDLDKVTSETELFLKFYRQNMIGITGTKGKSTTSSLVYSILKDAEKDVRLVGNIGVPMFGCLENLANDTILVCEMSSHQLENCKFSPHIAVLLNIFEEHLDHYESYEEYQLAKVNIFRHQNEDDFVIYSENSKIVEDYVKKYAKAKKNAVNIDEIFETNLIGEHNQFNISVAATVMKIFDVSIEVVKNAVKEFHGLPHRLEFVGVYDGIYYYNDSISTIPEATIKAVESLKNVDTLILGGMDRGIHYDSLVNFLSDGKVRNVVLMYETGKRIAKELNGEGVYLVENLTEAVNLAKKLTYKDKICLLSPAAASYGYFKNFEERGDKFKELIITKKCFA